MDKEEKAKLRLEKLSRNLAGAGASNSGGIVSSFLPIMPTAITSKQQRVIDNNNLENNLAIRAVLEKKRQRLKTLLY